MKYLVIMLFILLSCTQNKSNDFHEFVLNQIHENQNNKQLLLGRYNKTDWNKLYILGPYSKVTRYDTTLIFYQNLIQNTGIERRDDISLVLLFKDNKLLSLNEFNRKEADFSSLTKFNEDMRITYYTNGEAKFYFKKNKEGFFILSL